MPLVYNWKVESYMTLMAHAILKRKSTCYTKFTSFKCSEFRVLNTILCRIKGIYIRIIDVHSRQFFNEFV